LRYKRLLSADYQLLLLQIGTSAIHGGRTQINADKKTKLPGVDLENCDSLGLEKLYSVLKNLCKSASICG
jgi:hypothetical protein